LKKKQKKQMSYCSLSDAFPNWTGKEEDQQQHPKALYENFGSAAPSPPPSSHRSHREPSASSVRTTVAKELATREDFTLPLKTKRNDGPDPYDNNNDDYFKILASDWERNVADYQAQARFPFSPKKFTDGIDLSINGNSFLEEPQLMGKTHESQEEEEEENRGGCKSVAIHLDKCAGCRKRLEDVFRSLFESTSAKVKSAAPTAHQSLISQPVMDILLLVGIGIFIIFVLDAFVRLGRYLRR
jgi:hypothetical protein